MPIKKYITKEEVRLAHNRASNEWKKRNKQRLATYWKEYYQNNLEKLKRQMRERGKRRKYWLQDNARRQKNKRYHNNINVRLSHLIGTGIRKSIKRRKGGYHWELLVGYTVNELRAHLEKLFTKDMSWEDVLSGKIHIDHIKPKSSFNYKSFIDKEFVECWSLKNLQPLWAEDNINKGDKF